MSRAKEEEISAAARHFINTPKRTRKTEEPKTETTKKVTAKSDGKTNRQKVTAKSDGKTSRQKVTAESDGKNSRQKTTTETTSATTVAFDLELPRPERKTRRLELHLWPSMGEQIQNIAEQNNMSINDTVILILSAFLRGRAPVGEGSD